MFDDMSFSDLDLREQTFSTTVSGNLDEGRRALQVQNIPLEQ